MNGVGKTVTAIGRDFRIRDGGEEGATLIVCEKNGLNVWAWHLRAMGVEDEAVFVMDTTKRGEAIDEFNFLSANQGRFLYYVVTWDQLPKLGPLYERAGAKGTGRVLIEFLHVIADEVHLAKNRDTQRTKSLKAVKTVWKTGLSGTWVDNKPEDGWSILHWLYPRDYASRWKFLDRYVEIEEGERFDPVKMRSTGYRKLGAPKNLGEFRKRIEPFYIRRTLEQINPDMPEKVHVNPPIYVDLPPSMRRSYKQMQKKSLAEVGDQGYILVSGSHVAVRMRLQQMALATLDIESSVDEDWAYADAESDSPRIVLTKPSPKLDACMNMIELHPEESFVVWTHFRGMADLVEVECRSKGIPVSKITGETPVPERGKATEDFQSGRSRVFVGTIAAAGKGITLTAGHIALFLDRSENPNANKQAEDRIWRRTQNQKCLIYDFVARDTIDEVRLASIERKGRWTESMMRPRVPAGTLRRL